MGFFTKKQSTTGDPFLDAVVTMQSDDNTTYTSAGAIRNSDIFTAVSIIASDIASSPLQVIKDGVPKKDSGITNLIDGQPNEVMDGWHLKFSLAVNMLLNGNSFAEIKRDGNKVQSIELLPNSSVTVTQTDNGELRYNVGDKKRRVPKENMLHFKYFTQDGLTGLSPLYALRDEIKIQKAGNKMIDNFFSRGINSNGILKVNKAVLDNEAKQNIREKFEESNGSQNGANTLRTIILDESMDYQAMEVNTDVLKLANSKDWTSRQIAAVFRIPVERLGVENTHSSSTQSSLIYVKETLIHYLNCFVSELSNKLGKNFRFNVDRMLESDPDTKVKNILEQVQGSLITINEGRSKLGLPPRDGGDRLLASLNYTYLDTLEEYQRKENVENGEE
ncbi:phage portal protein [Tetragenococcus koreensis]|uniref:Phage portal protein n=1 Tax=Tetragenococcus koreensis TaxID=290335 RepID=A0AAN4ZP19_9ENTE|nr:phage portal protein [Tetragenococcus koreensis]MCF1584572.1 phage portal protein [Tetragenococcus koreensis]MCF1628895.1 phage portal protein [Tetragenococcus koreensis]MCF1641923.1 phage portal protein [Tetragenococcus koreensis]MDN6344735.1 phage portal protein [Tetragenococcus koreensis]GEQ49813.1 phage portal protein [Tetragenococcus koreensis]